VLSLKNFYLNAHTLFAFGFTGVQKAYAIQAGRELRVC